MHLHARTFTVLATLCILCASPIAAVEPLTLYHAINTPVAKPTCAAFEPGNDSRLYVLEKDSGDIWLHQNGNRVGRYLHLDVANEGERGLLTLAFDPDFQSNGYCYVFYSAPGGTSVIDRYTRDAGDANRADPSSRLELLRIPRGDGDVHYGSWMGFTPAAVVTANPDNKHWLYITVGDASDGGNAQSLATRNGKILRIDVDPTRFGIPAQPYGIPSANPWASQAAPRNEFIAIGVRNPWRAGFDRATGDLWLCDVGAVSHEEVDRIPYAALSGASTSVLNLGWPAWEGAERNPNNPMSPEVPDHFAPIRSFGSGAYIGGRVYRGSAMPGWQGSYIWSNFGTPMLAMMGGDPNNLRTDLKTEIEGNLGQGIGQITSFAEDNAGELYAVVFEQGGFGGGAVMRFAPYDPNQRPARFTSQPELYATVGFPYTYNVVVDGLPSVTLTAPELPAGMTGPAVTASTPPTLRATLSWTPSVIGTFPVRLRAESTGIGPAAWQEFTVTVQGPRLADVDSGSAAVRGGLDWASFVDDPADGYWDMVPDFPGLTPAQRGSVASVVLPAGMPDDRVAVRYSGYLRVDSEGVYRFKATADDRVRVSVGGRLVYDYDSAPARANPAASGSIALQPGYHRIEIGYLEQAGGQSIDVQWQPVGATGFSAIPAANLYRPAVDSAYGLEGHRGVTPYLGTFPATAGSEPPARLSQTGAFSDLATLTPAPGIIAYDVASPLWSDDAAKARWMAVPTGGTIGFTARDNWAFPAGTVLIKHFAIDTPTGLRRLETRFLIMNGTGAYGVTYIWNEAGTDADLDPGDEASSLEVTRADGRRQRWNFPSRTNCMECHTPASGYALGLRTAQLNRTFAFTTVDGLTRTDNQLRAYGAAGLLSQPYSEQLVPAYDRLVRVDDTTAELAHRVRSYLDANCSSCHRPGAVSNVALDTRFRATETMEGILDQPASLAVGAATGLKLLASNHPEQSAIWLRMNTTDPAHRMPKLGRELIHPQAVGAVYEYIMSRNAQSAGPRPPVVNAGTDRAITVGYATGLVAEVVNESALPLSLAWSASPAAGVTISGGTTATPTVTIASPGTYALTLTASSGGLSTSDVIVLQAQANSPPSVSMPTTATAFTGVPLAVRPLASDADGLPTGALSYQWSVVSGPGTPTFAPAATARDVDVAFPSGGAYVLRLTVGDGQLTASADLSVSVDAIIAAIDCGNAAGTPVSAGGMTWAFDPLQAAGSERVESPAGGDFAGTDIYDAVLRTNRTGTSAYAFTGLDPSGIYRVRVLTTEVYFTNPGSRQFDVFANDVRVLQAVDPFALGGGKFAYGEALSATFSPSSSGMLSVRFQSVIDAALVCGMRLERLAGGSPPVNQPPVASATASASSVTLPMAVATLNGAGSDPEGRALTYAWSVLSGAASAVTFADPTAATTSVSFGAAGSYVLRLTVTDDLPQSAVADVGVSVLPEPAPGGWTVVRAIDSGFVSGPAITADGITWELDPTMAADRIEGPADVAGTTTLDAVYQSNRTAPDFSYLFTGLAAGSYRARILTTEVWFDQAGSRVFAVQANGVVVADGVDPFALGGGKHAAGSVTTATFAPDPQGAVELRFIASADQALVSAVVLELEDGAPIDQPPSATAVASAGSVALPSASVTLTGTGSDPEGQTLSYAWSVVSGPAGGATIADAAMPTASAAFSLPGTYVLRLTITDGKPQSTSADVTVIVQPAAGWTVVRAIDSGFVSGPAITADGIVWELDPAMAADRIEGPADVAGTTTLDAVYRSNRTGGDFTYTFTGLDPLATYRVRVLTTEVWFDQAGSRIFGVSANGVPIAAGIDPFAISGGKFAAGSVTTATFACDAAGAVALRFQATADQALVSALVLERDGGEPGNLPPSAIASSSAASVVLPDAQVSLSGVGSDPEGGLLTYAWSAVSGGAVTFATPTAASTIASFAAAGTYVLRLSVSDDLQQTATADVTVTVLPAAIGDPAIQISFQPSTATLPSDWLADTGALYAARGGQSYGWDADISADTRVRNVNPDPVLDSLIHVAKAAPRTWEITLPVGIYDVDIAAGDPSYQNSTNSFTVEGQVLTDATPQSSNYDVFTLRVTVEDGRLTIGQAATGANAKLQAVVITPVPAGGG